jgi:DHA1 family inner membrane transport protein
MTALMLFLHEGSVGQAPNVRKELKVLLRPVVLQAC